MMMMIHNTMFLLILLLLLLSLSNLPSVNSLQPNNNNNNNNNHNKNVFQKYYYNSIDTSTMKTIQQIQRNILHITASTLLLPTDWIDVWLNPMMEPKVQSHEEQERRNQVSKLLQEGWNDMDGYDISDEDLNDIDSLFTTLDTTTSSSSSSGTINVRTDQPSTYGEVTELGARQLFQRMGLTSSSSSSTTRTTKTHNKKNDDNSKMKHVFYDLGSGVGRLVSQAYMELPTVDKFVGIELSPSRHQAAMNAWELVKDDATQIRQSAIVSSQQEEKRIDEQKESSNAINSKKHKNNDGDLPSTPSSIPSSSTPSSSILELYQGNLFDIDLSDATHIYIASLCFTDTMMYQIAMKLKMEAPKLQCVATLKRLPTSPYGSTTSSSDQSFFQYMMTNQQQQQKPQIHRVEMTWTEIQGTGCLVYFYFP